MTVDPQGPALDHEKVDGEVDEVLLRDELARTVRAGLAELPAQRRQLLELLAADPPVSYEEISRRLGMPVGSIGPTRARALAQLRNTRALRAWDAAEAAGGDGHHVPAQR